MACLLQPECNFLHRYFRCKLPIEVVDVEVKVMSMQGTHIFRRDRMTQLVRCMLWTPNLHPHPNMGKKMRTFLEVENKMGPIIPAPANQYRLLLPETNPNVRKDNASKKRRTVTLKRRFRPVAPKATVMHSCYVRQCLLVLKIVLYFFKCLGFHMLFISLYDALSSHNYSSSGSLVFTCLGGIN